MGRGGSRGGAGQAERQRPMDALSTRGRRGVSSIHWRGDSRGVIARGAAKRRQRRLGEEDPARIERAREVFQTGADWAHMEVTSGANRGGRHFSMAKLSQKLNYGQELVNTKVVEDGPNYNFHIGTFL